VRAVTVWALLGSFDWHCLVTRCEGHYEPGPFDLAGGIPRPTALAGLMRELAAGVPPSHPVIGAPGWWRRPGRYLCSMTEEAPNVARLEDRRAARADAHVPPLLLVGRGALAQALLQRCQERHIAVQPLPGDGLDDELQRLRALQQARPWAVVHAGLPPDAAAWAIACADLGIHCTCFCTPAFDGAGEAAPPVLDFDRRALLVETLPPAEGLAGDDASRLLDHVIDLVVDRHAGHVRLVGEAPAAAPPGGAAAPDDGAWAAPAQQPQRRV
jgi:hypothetical protein